MADLFDFVDPVARNTDPDTSHKAAKDVKITAGKDRHKVLVILSGFIYGGLTDYELAERMNRQQNSAGKRRSELRDAGYVEDTGLRRPAPSGSSAIVWRITESGRKILEKVGNSTPGR